MINDERLSAYLDGELSEAERAEVEALLSASEPHRTALEELRWVKDSLAALPDVEPVGDLRPAVQPIRTKRHTPKIAAAAAAVAAVAAAWLLVFVFASGVDRIPAVPNVEQLAVAHADPTFTPMPPNEVDTPAPASIDGMDRAGVFQQDEVVQVRYSDGAHAISVFHQPGEIEWDSMPGHGEMMMMDDQPAWHGVVDRMDVFVVQRGELMVTIVADPDLAEMAARVPAMLEA